MKDAVIEKAEKSMDIVNVALGASSYDIHIGQGLIEKSGLIASTIKGNKVFIVSNKTIAPLFVDPIKNQLQDFEVSVFLLPDGEQYKTLQHLEAVIAALLTHQHNRHTTIIAVGGGVVGDTAGFAAAIYQRGIDFIQIPTTLLAQVDSSVGGKTAVNHPLGKNMIGAFHQPRAVIIDTATLQSLPPRELSAGLAEVVKHGILADSRFFDWLERNAEQLLNLDEVAIRHAVRRCCEIKAGIVSADEKESGVRATLNLGHTFGHAIETHEGYGNWLHGEAVATGLVLAADLSMRTGRISRLDAGRVKSLLQRLRLPVCPPEGLGAEKFIELMQLDKKATDSGIRFILMDAIGEVSIIDGVDPTQLEKTLDSKNRLCE